MGEECMLAVQEVELFVLLPIPAVEEVTPPLVVVRMTVVVSSPAAVCMMNTTELLLV
jgi:hypothetical protein